MSGFILTNKAKADLKEIGIYTQDHWGREQRDKYLTMIDACFHELADNPDKGKDCSDILSGYRKYGIGSHMIFYCSKQNDLIEIVRVLHGRMDIETRLAVH
jgi:toxin ParE1/3/4